jgi:uncharacterized membrane protein YhhN
LKKLLNTPKFWLVLFAVDAAIELLAVHFKLSGVHFFAKPFITLLLLAFAIFSTSEKNWILLYLSIALLCSCLGDVFLLFDEKNENWFVLGLASFLLAHIFYILVFIRVRKVNRPFKKINWLLGIPLVLYTAFLFVLLKPSLGSLKIPVFIYATVLAAMAFSSLIAFDFSKQRFGVLCICGTLLFVSSDSFLAINKFYHPFENAGLLVMATYIAAQFLIVLGITKYLSRKIPAKKISQPLARKS